MKLIRLVPALAVIAALMLLIAGPGTRLGLWEFGFGFTLMRWALYVGVGVAIIGVVLVLIPRTRKGNLGGLLAAVVIGLGTAAVPYLWVQQAQSVPRIHDITTDTLDPPPFVAIAPLREDAPNPLAYPGEETAEQQREAYPDIVTYRSDADPTTIFEHALAVVERKRWELVDAVQEEGRVEATHTTFWFGFKDDVVIRIRAANGGSEVDVRSKSRVGMSDVGANAARIRGFLDSLEERLH